MSPLELLRKGLQEGDWAPVSKGFALLTGETIEPPESSDDRPFLLELQRLIEGRLGGSCETPDDEEPQPPFQPDIRPQKNHVNLFIDDGTLHKADKAIDKKLTKGKAPSPRRPKVVKVPVVCSRCNKKETVDPIFAPKKLEGNDYTSYLCDKCLGSRRPGR